MDFIDLFQEQALGFVDFFFTDFLLPISLIPDLMGYQKRMSRLINWLAG